MPNITTIQPCCTQKHIPAVRRQLEKQTTVAFEGYGDLTLADLLPVLGDTCIGHDLTIVAPNIPRYLRSAILHSMTSTVVRQGKNTPRHPHLTIVTDTSEERSPDLRHLAESMPDRITLCHAVQSDTMLLLPDELWFGNIGRGARFVGVVTRDPNLIATITSPIRQLSAKHHPTT